MSIATMTEDERKAHAQRALEEFKRLISIVYAPLLRAITGKKNLKVEPAAKISATDGKTVWLMVPWVLGETREHDRLLCGKRDPHLEGDAVCRLRIKGFDRQHGLPRVGAHHVRFFRGSRAGSTPALGARALPLHRCRQPHPSRVVQGSSDLRPGGGQLHRAGVLADHHKHGGRHLRQPSLVQCSAGSRAFDAGPHGESLRKRIPPSGWNALLLGRTAP